MTLYGQTHQGRQLTHTAPLGRHMTRKQMLKHIRRRLRAKPTKTTVILANPPIRTPARTLNNVAFVWAPPYSTIRHLAMSNRKALTKQLKAIVSYTCFAKPLTPESIAGVWLSFGCILTDKSSILGRRLRAYLVRNSTNEAFVAGQVLASVGHSIVENKLQAFYTAVKYSNGNVVKVV